MKGRDITVVIPAHNAAAFIGQALDGVAAQTAPPARIIVVNNGSSDNSAAKVDDWARVSTIPVHQVITDYGQVSNARNIGFSMAETALIAMLDADDIYEPDFLETALRAFNARPGLALFFGERMLFDDTGLLDRRMLDQSPLKALPLTAIEDDIQLITGGLFEALAQSNFVSPSGAVVSRLAAYAAHLFSPRLKTSEDRDFMCRLALTGEAAFTPRVMTRYRLHGNSAMEGAGAIGLGKNALRCILGLARDADLLGLTAPQKAALDAAARRTARMLIYSASTQGMTQYRLVRRWLRDMGTPVPMDIKAPLRALAGGRRRQAASAAHGRGESIKSSG